MKFFTMAIILVGTSGVFAKTNTTESAKRYPSAEKSLLMVRTTSIKRALSKIEKSEVYKSLVKSLEDDVCPIDNLTSESVIVVFNGKNGPSKRVMRHLVPVTATCDGTGMIEKTVAFIQLDSEVDMDSEKGYFSFAGFRKTTLVTKPGTAEEIGAFSDL